MLLHRVSYMVAGLCALTALTFTGGCMTEVEDLENPPFPQDVLAKANWEIRHDGESYTLYLEVRVDSDGQRCIITDYDLDVFEPGRSAIQVQPGTITGSGQEFLEVPDLVYAAGGVRIEGWMKGHVYVEGRLRSWSLDVNDTVAFPGQPTPTPPTPTPPTPTPPQGDKLAGNYSVIHFPVPENDGRIIWKLAIANQWSEDMNAQQGGPEWVISYDENLQLAAYPREGKIWIESENVDGFHCIRHPIDRVGPGEVGAITLNVDDPSEFCGGVPKKIAVRMSIVWENPDGSTITKEGTSGWVQIR